MNRYLVFVVGIFLFTLNGCAPFKFNDKRAAICNELNSQIIFNASTSDTRAAEIQRTEEALMQHSYQTHQCDQK